MRLLKWEEYSGCCSWRRRKVAVEESRLKKTGLSDASWKSVLGFWNEDYRSWISYRDNNLKPVLASDVMGYSED